MHMQTGHYESTHQWYYTHLHVFLEAIYVICCFLLKLVYFHPKADCCHLCLPTHHQFTQSIVDENVLRLTRNRRSNLNINFFRQVKS